MSWGQTLLNLQQASGSETDRELKQQSAHIYTNYLSKQKQNNNNNKTQNKTHTKKNTHKGTNESGDKKSHKQQGQLRFDYTLGLNYWYG